MIDGTFDFDDDDFLLFSEAEGDEEEVVEEPTEEPEPEEETDGEETEEQIDNSEEDVTGGEEEPTDDDSGADETDADSTEEGDEETEETTDEEEETVESNDDENTKKYKILQDYKDLLEITKESKISISHINVEVSDTAEKTYEVLNATLDETIKKLEFIMYNSFETFEYKKLLTIYLYLKTNVKVTAEILDKIIK